MAAGCAVRPSPTPFDDTPFLTPPEAVLGAFGASFAVWTQPATESSLRRRCAATMLLDGTALTAAHCAPDGVAGRLRVASRELPAVMTDRRFYNDGSGVCADCVDIARVAPAERLAPGAAWGSPVVGAVVWWAGTGARRDLPLAPARVESVLGNRIILSGVRWATHGDSGGPLYDVHGVLVGVLGGWFGYGDVSDDGGAEIYATAVDVMGE